MTHREAWHWYVSKALKDQERIEKEEPTKMMPTPNSPQQDDAERQAAAVAKLFGVNPDVVANAIREGEIQRQREREQMKGQ